MGGDAGLRRVGTNGIVGGWRWNLGEKTHSVQKKTEACNWGGGLHRKDAIKIMEGKGGREPAAGCKWHMA